jgi:hypothetical protein
MKMKKLFLSTFVLIGLFATSCKENAAAKIDQTKVEDAAVRDAVAGDFPKIEFNKTAHDFGEIQNGTPVETVFSYTNVGSSPLVVTDIKSTCGCTVPKDWSREPLAPGASSQFTVKFNGRGANTVSKTITLTTNTESGREQVKISAFIKPDPNAPTAKPNLKQQ